MGCKNYMGWKIGTKSEINTNKSKYQSWTRIWAMDELVSDRVKTVQTEFQGFRIKANTGHKRRPSRTIEGEPKSDFE